MIVTCMYLYIMPADNVREFHKESLLQPPLPKVNNMHDIAYILKPIKMTLNLKLIPARKWSCSQN